ncbi:MAG: hypothetical protein HeimC3_43140 [Candidatus Heimdallarchaeota archaeon LC_3]|nr:MAG: hypothetical protein HeimC3_43140 [Candidatus Heimdallarchaeota archaeon LC_3]
MKSLFSNNSVILRIISAKKYKNVFSPAHILLSLYFFHTHLQGGRYSLSKFILVNESKARTIIDCLTNSNLLISSKGRAGSTLTNSGKQLCENIFNYYKVLKYDQNWNLGILSVGNINSLVTIPIDKNYEDKINVLELRDQIIKSGTIGATIFHSIKKHGKLESLTFYKKQEENLELDENYKLAFKSLLEEIKPLLGTLEHNKSWIIVAGTNNYNKNKSFSKKEMLNSTLLATIQGILQYGF